MSYNQFDNSWRPEPGKYVGAKDPEDDGLCKYCGAEWGYSSCPYC